MGKRRNAAKTGDKKLYSRRQELSNSTSPKKSVQQSMDEWQDERDESYLALSPKKALDDPADDPITAKHHILDLGVSDDSSDEGNRDDDDEGDSDEESALNDKSSKQLNKDKSAPLESESDSDDDSEMEDDAEDLEQVDPRNWGRKKSAYYDADTGDLEIGQDEDVSLFDWTYNLIMNSFSFLTNCNVGCFCGRSCGKRSSNIPLRGNGSRRFRPLG